jgi:hypothetical protein
MADKTLATLGHKRKEFSYSGSIWDGVVLKQTGHPQIDASFFTAALSHFAGQTVMGGFSEDSPIKGGFGEWVRDASSRLNSRMLSPRHGSFMAAILCKEAAVKSWLEGNAVVLQFPAVPVPDQSSR